MYLFIFLSFSYSAYAANITLAYDECKVIANDTICAPTSQLVNETLAYKTCIADFSEDLADIRSEFDDLVFEVSKNITRLDGVNFVDKYNSCFVELNGTQTSLKHLDDELKQRTDELSVVQKEVESVKNTFVNPDEKARLQAEAEAARTDARKQGEEKIVWGIGGIIVGAALVYYRLRGLPRQSSDSRGGRMLPGGRV